MLNLKKDIEENNLKKCYLIYGDEAYLIKTYEDRLKMAAVGSNDDIMNIEVFDDRKLTAGKVIDSAETLPFLSEKRFVLVRDSGFFKAGKKDETEAIAKYIADVPESTVLVFSENEIDKRNAAYKAVNKFGYAAEMKALDEKSLIKWIAVELKKKKIAIDNGAAAYLIRATGADMTAIVSEINKLASFCEEKAKVEIKDIDEVCVFNPELKIFEMVGAMGNKNVQKAIEIYRNMILYNEKPMGILAMITRQFRLMYECSMLLESGEVLPNIAAKVGIRDFMVRDYLRQASNFSSKRLKEAIVACLETDAGIKMGMIKDVLAVELLLIEYSL